MNKNKEILELKKLYLIQIEIGIDYEKNQEAGRGCSY